MKPSFFANLARWLSRNYACRSARRGTSRSDRPIRRSLRPRIESLEDRTMLNAYLVTNLADSGFGSLRQATLDANANPGADSIVFTPGLSGTIVLRGELSINDSLTITGPGANVIAISGNNTYRVLENSSVLSLSGLTITDGYGYLRNGGGILNEGTLTISNCTFSHNTSYGVDNTEGGAGGAIFNSSGSSLTLNNCTLADNVATTPEIWGSFGGSGGGIYNLGSLYISNCTLSGNVAEYGGGIAFFEASGVIHSCTLTGNGRTSAGANGGGLNIIASALTCSNNIIAGNLIGADGWGPDVAGYFNSSANNLIGNSSGGSGFSGSDLLNVDPLLAPLGNYGGRTETCALLPGSPAIDAGENSSAPATDQRGQGRVGAADIGAFESQGFTVSIFGGDNQSAPVNTAFSAPLVVRVTANDSVEPVDGGQVTFAAPRTGPSASLSGNPATISGGLAGVTARADGVIGTYFITTSANGSSAPPHFTLTNVEVPSLIVTTLADETSDTDGTTSLREALAYANSLGGNESITFAPSLFTHGAATITLNSANGPLVDNDTTGTVTIMGPGATKLAVSGGNAVEVFDVASGAAAVLDGLTISHGRATYGGGILNNGTLILENSTLSKNVATAEGGGIYNTGSLTVTQSVLSGNSASDGAAICSSNAYLNQAITVSDSTISGNSAPEGIGGGIYFFGSTLTIDRSTISDNTASDGGGLFLRYGNITISNSTISGNSAAGLYGGDNGGGINLDFTAQLTVTNCTFSGNSAAQGGAIWDSSVAGTSAAMTVTSCTVSGNSATDSGGGIWNNNRFPLVLYLFDTIVAGNSAPNGPDIAGLVNSGGHNLIGNSSGGSGFAASDLLNINPVLAPLGNYGGPTQTFGLLPGSPAIDAGDSTGAPAKDQRGDNRFGAADIGAFESQGFSLTSVSGNNQMTLTGTPFADPLIVRAIANNSLEPVAGGLITFTAPSTGASTNPTVVTATIAGNGQASPTVWANSTVGSYTVTAAAHGSTGTPTFGLSNIGMVTTLLDETDPNDGVYSLREAVAAVNRAGGDHTITFDPSLFTGGAATITLNSANGPLTDTDSTGTVTIAGPGAATLAISGGDATQVFLFWGSTSAVLDGLTICHGQGTYGGGINNSGTLTVRNSTLSNNVATYGGGIANAGVLAVTNCTLSNNSAVTSGQGFGGAIYTVNYLYVSNSTLSGNNALNLGGGIYSERELTVYDSTISDNSARDGGGLFVGAAFSTIKNSTIARNSAALGGAVYVAVDLRFDYPVYFENCTVSGNSASDSGGGIYLYSPLTIEIASTIVAANTAPIGPDIRGVVRSWGLNLIGNSSGASGFVANDLLNVNPLLGPLGNYGGPTQTFALLPGSPAINGGWSDLSTDQRGQGRVGTVDIGAFESQGFALSIVSGNNQVATTGAAFANPLVVKVTANNAVEPVAGGVVTFKAPNTGASTNPAVVTATVAGNGWASASETADSTEGYYTVAASANGATPTVNFSLANSPVIVISPTTLPDATAGVNYSQSLAASGGIGPYTYAVTAGSLPSGFSLSSDGVLSGSNTTAATYTFTVTATDADSFTGSEAYSLTIDPAATGQFVVAGFPTPITVGVAGNFTVTAEDAFGNFTPGYTGTVHFTSSDLQAALPGDATLTNGVGTFSATLKTAGTQSLTATDTANGSITGSQSGIVVNPAAATRFVLSGFPSPTTAGAAGSFTVTAKDAYGNVATGYTGTVHFSSSDGQAVLPGDETLTNGVGTFSATLKTAGAQSLTVTDAANGSIKGSQTGIIVNPAATGQFVASSFPSPTTAGVAGQFTVTAEDAYGNITPAYSGTVHFTSSDGQASLPANATLTNGVGTFTATLKTAGRQTLTATDTANSAITGSQSGIVVNPNVAVSLVIIGPSSVKSGVAFSTTVTAHDAYGNVATGYRGTIAFKCADNNAVLPKTYTFTAADAGVHTFTGLSLKKKGLQSITITDTLNSLLTYSWLVDVL
jgi:CSLREA domain-containing protein